MQKILLAIFFLSVSFFCSCATKKLPVKTLSIEKSDGKIVEIAAEIADTFETRQHGFMERTKIPDGTGMLFVFEKDEIQNFWMKNTPHPLSIAYIDSSWKIRDIFDMKPYSLANVTSTTSVRYALEVPQGYFERVGVQKGDRVFVNLSGESEKTEKKAVPEQSEKSSEAKIHIKTKKAGKTVFLNGNAHGKTPLTITSLVPGVYTLSFDSSATSEKWTIEVQPKQFDSYYFE